MFAKKFKRKCSVRGCKNTDNVYVISRRREMSNTIAMCRDCMREALAVTENFVEPEKAKREVQPLFPHPELVVTTSSVAVDDEEPKPQEVIEEVTEDNSVSVTEDSVTIKKPEKPKAVTKPNNESKKK